MKLLVVDDEPHIRQMMRLTLEAAGYEVDEAATGEEGLAKFDLPTPWLKSGMAERRIPGGKLTVLNPVPPIRRVWLRATEALSAKSQVLPILSIWIRLPY